MRPISSMSGAVGWSDAKDFMASRMGRYLHVRLLNCADYYPVQRQMLPSNTSSTCCAVGVGLAAIRLRAGKLLHVARSDACLYMVITMPELQNPHWVPLCDARAVCNGLYAVLRPPMPSMVVTVHPSMEHRGRRHCQS